MFANLIGKQERIDVTHGSSGGKSSSSEQIREVHVVMPTELQSLPKLEDYLTIADGTPPARVKIQAQSYPKNADRFIPINVAPRNDFTPFLPHFTCNGSNSRKKLQSQCKDPDRFPDRGH
jgi:type IV secretory pathway TraG/TraD family ATPase VirD4